MSDPETTQTTPTAQWMQDYLTAWTSNEPDDIEALFTEDAAYQTEPFAAPWRGRQEIVDGWLEIADDPGSFTFEWAPVIETLELAVVQGTTRYTDGPTYSNLWVIRFAPDGRASEFTEWYMDQTEESNDEE